MDRDIVRAARWGRCARATLGAVALALSACAAPPLPPRPAGITPPLSWSVAPSGAAPIDLADWWQGFHDPTLTELITRALDRNTDVRIAQARLAQSRAARELALAGLRPVLSASVSAQRNSADTSSSTSRTAQGSLLAGWDLDLFGSARRGAQAASADLQSSDLAMAATRVSIAAEVGSAYVQLRAGQARLKLAADLLQAQTQTDEITRWRAKAGLASALEVEQSRAALAQLQALLPTLAASVVQTSDALAVLAGDLPLAWRERLAEPTEIPIAPPDLALDIPAKTLRQRPDVRAAEMAVDAAAARVSQAGASHLPSFLLQSSLAWKAMSVGSLGGSAARALIGSTNLPLLDGGTRRAQVHGQEAQFEAALAAYDASSLLALQEVEDLLAGLAASRDRLAALHVAADAAQNAALLANHRHAAGLIDFQIVLDTQRTLLSALDAETTTRAELAIGHVRLFKALGGGWKPLAERP